MLHRIACRACWVGAKLGAVAAQTTLCAISPSAAAASSTQRSSVSMSDAGGGCPTAAAAAAPDAPERACAPRAASLLLPSVGIWRPAARKRAPAGEGTFSALWALGSSPLASLPIAWGRRVKWMWNEVSAEVPLGARPMVSVHGAAACGHWPCTCSRQPPTAWQRSAGLLLHHLPAPSC